MRGKHQSDLEQIMESALVNSGFKKGDDFSYDYPPRAKYRYRVDFAFPEIKLGIECDGEYYHSPGNGHDQRKDAFLRRNGWIMLRFTGTQIKEDLSGCLVKIKEEIGKIK